MSPISAPSQPTPRRGRRLAGLLALALLLGGGAGGVAGGVATWLLVSRGLLPAAPVAAPAATTATLAQTASSAGQIAPASTATTSSSASGRSLAGQIYEQSKRSVLEVRRSGGGRGRGALGTGFVIDDQGHVLTNAHVVGSAAQVDLTVLDGSTVTARVVNRDPADDLAVLSATFPAGAVQPAPLGDSSALKVGDPVVAIGNPYGLQRSVTSGIVSGTGRTWNAGGVPIRNVIQTDAPINPGNSGGPLFNGSGEVVGINTGIESDTRQWMGVGFAVPINTAKRVLPDLLAGRKIERAWMGISAISVTPTVASDLKLGAKAGVLVQEVVPDSPAARAGLRAPAGSAQDPSDQAPRAGGDLLTSIDGQSLNSMDDLTGYLDGRNVGDTITLGVLRDGKPIELRLTLGPWPERQR